MSVAAATEGGENTGPVRQRMAKGPGEVRVVQMQVSVVARHRPEPCRVPKSSKNIVPKYRQGTGNARKDIEKVASIRTPIAAKSYTKP